MDEALAPRAASRGRVFAAVALWAVVMGVAAVATGCYGRNCEGETVVYGRNPGEGRLISADLWESSPIDGRWLDFPKQRVYIFELDELGDRAPEMPIVYISAVPDPLHDEGGQFTVAAGNLAEFFGAQKGRIGVKNGTCADYYMRLVVPAAPRPPESSNGDAGSDAEAGP